MARLDVRVGKTVLKNPLIAGSAEHLIDADGVRRALRAGVGAVVVKSINETERGREVVHAVAPGRERIDQGAVGHGADSELHAEARELVVEDAVLVVQRDHFVPLLREAATERAAGEAHPAGDQDSHDRFS